MVLLSYVESCSFLIIVCEKYRLLQCVVCSNRYIHLREKNNTAINYCSYKVSEQSMCAHLLISSNKINVED